MSTTTSTTNPQDHQQYQLAAAAAAANNNAADQRHQPSWRNIVLYVAGTYALSITGGLLMYHGADIGGLVFVMGPILMATLLRACGGDGWADAGWGCGCCGDDDASRNNNIKRTWPWYIVSIGLYPATFVIVILFGLATGITEFNPTTANSGENNSNTNYINRLWQGIAANLIPRMLFALFEEAGWRGYLEPRLAALHVPALRRHVTTGVIWAVWHFPLILSTPYTDVPLALFLPLFVLGMTVAAVVYGQIRSASGGAVWTAVLLHGSANVVIFGILDSEILMFHSKIGAYISPESVMVMVLWGMLGAYLMRRNQQQEQQQSGDESFPYDTIT